MSGRLGERARQVGTGLALLALAGSAVYGGDLFGVRTAVQGEPVPDERAPAVGRTSGPSPSSTVSPAGTRVRSQPWWQSVATLTGDGSGSGTVAIDPAALQWRVSWSCTAGGIVVSAPDVGDALVEASCPGDDVVYATTTGRTELSVRTGGSWELVVEQQVDVPLVEAPTPAMRDGEVVASGTFYDIDQTGRGEVVVYELADGGHAVRLEEFFVTPNVDLEVRLSPLEAPETTEQYLSAESVLVSVLDATAGSMNFEVPGGVDVGAYGSVVIWCPPVDSAYAAATLRAGDRS